MVISHSSFTVGANNLEKRKKMAILKKDVYTNDAGDIKETTGGLPKGWAKGKLLGKKGDEISDLQAKEWGLDKAKAKAKAPAENKAKQV